jgi:ribosomal protein S18 acetylase RimI-like enzyme
VTSSIIIRNGRPEDAHALGRLGALLVAEHHEFDPQRFVAPIPQLPQRYAQFLTSQMERSDKIVLVADRDGAVVGYVYGGVEGNDYMVLRGPAAEIYDLVVDPNHRRQGIGSLLLQAALDAVEKLGAPRAVLFTAARNEGAQAMFSKLGFRRTMIEMTRELGGDQGSAA